MAQALAADTHLLRATERVWAQIVPLWPLFTVELQPELDSTNTELMRRARARDLAPSLLVAQRQTAGRGRMGRSWLGEPGAALLCSVGAPLSPPDWSGLSLAVGVAVAESLHADIALKWPNDLWLQGRKLGGILVETASVGSERYAVVGLGLNMVAPQDAALTAPTAGLRECIPQANPGMALQALAPPLVQALQLFEREGFAPFAPRFAARDALRGLRLRTSEGLVGIGQGVDAQGALLVHTAQGQVALRSTEVSVRPA